MATIVADEQHTVIGDEPVARPRAAFGSLAVGGLASLGAGAIHAAAIGVHNEHRQAVIVFAVLAVLQLGWGAVALVRSGRPTALVGLVINAAAVGGWILAKSSGIGFVDGLEETEGIQLADGMAAALAAAAVVVAARRLVRSPGSDAPLRRSRVLGAFAIGIAALSLLGMTEAGSHSHAGDGHGHEATASGAVDESQPHAHPGDSGDSGEDAGASATTDESTPHDHPAAVAPQAYDPTLPIDLSGVAGVTPEQQARAENLIAITLIELPQWADTAHAEEMGFNSIGDSFTGVEHFINWDYIDDGRTLDPDHPEALVYEPQPDGSRKLVSAMFMLAPGTTLEDVPDLGGSLTQWHIHDNLCFSDDPVAPKVNGITRADGTCRPPLEKFTPVPMIHVWITPHPCGPFAALEGVAAGQIKEGETRLCDHAHGS